MANIRRENSNTVYRLAYLSEAKLDFTQNAIDTLEEKSSQANAQLGVTGYISYIHPVFFGYLEGDGAAVLHQMNSIQQDSRHNVISMVDLGESEERLFVNWGMIIQTGDIRLQPIFKDLMIGAQKFIHGGSEVREMVLRTVRMVAAHHELMNDITKESELERTTMRLRTSAMSA